MAESRQYSYFAFISYSREDERWAKWLQNRLETYHLPAAVRKKHADTPRRIAPVFRDKTDLSGGVLQQQLHNEMDDSRFLILICSPHSAASEWVDREVRHFIDRGREEQIIPFVVDGEAGQGAFPPSLRRDEEKSLLGISVQELGRTAAFLRVVSTMLGLKYDELARRHRRRVLRRGAAAAVLTVLALAAAGRTWWYYTPHSAYYANYVTRYEIPEGVNELSAQQRQGLGEFFHIVTRKGKPVLLERVNAAGELVDPALMTVSVEYPRTEFVYNEEGLIARAELYSVSGQKMLQKTFTYDLENRRIAIDYQQPGDSLQALTMLGSTGEYYAAYTVEDDYRSDIARRLNTYDESGLLVESLYLRDNRNTPACDASGVYGVRYGYNEQGLVVQAVNLDENGDVHASRYGVAEERFTYDAAGRVVLGSTYDSGGELVRDQYGYAQMQVEYDETGNMAAYSYMDDGGMSCTSVERIARTEVEYDQNGRMIRTRVFDVAGEPAYDGSFGVHETRYTYDERGSVTSLAFFDGDGQPMYNSSGCSELRLTYDGEGRETSRLAYDTDGQLCSGFEGMAGAAFTYDENGYYQTITYIGTDGEPGVNADGFVTMRCVNDSMGNRLREEYLDGNGELTENADGAAVLVCDYDSIGNLVSMSSFDAEQKPCLWLGSSQIRYGYKNGNRVSVSYFGVDGEPISLDGVHEIRTEYDDRGNAKGESYYDEQGQLVRDGCARMELEVDSWGNELERRYYDAEGQPAQHDGGSVQYWKREQEYDRWGNRVRLTYESLTGEYPDNYCTVATDYNGYHEPVRSRYLDENGQFCEDADGTAALINTYDEKNQLIRQEYFDINGEPGNDYGITAVERHYDGRGRVIFDLYWRPDDNGGECMDYMLLYDYDEYGELASKRFLDIDGAAG